MLECPPADKLNEFLSGSCPPAESDRIEEHIAVCSSCCEFCLSSGSDEELLSELRDVLEDQSDNEKKSPSAPPTGEAAPTDEPESIAGFRIIRELGRGGMGVVYLAEQESTGREVALKVLLEGPFASTTARKRFEREVEVVARLSHPHVVTVYESGITSGRHYFAMEYVRGRRLDRYVKKNNLSLEDTLRLYAKVCRALAYAHQRGVIHRDIKPSNILVDESGEPHILDFGLARHESDAERTMLSSPGSIVGTLPFMAPEQVDMPPGEIDVRTDVYACGVVFYHVLTGLFPYPLSPDLPRTMKHILETPPTPLRRHRSEIDRDVETIALRALAKEPERRYQSAGALAEDLERYLDGRPIDARRDDSLYVFRRFLGRHRIAVSVALVLLIATGFGLVATMRARATRIREAVNTIMALAVSDFEAARQEASSTSPTVQARLGAEVDRMVASDAYTERVSGARASVLVNPEAFWESVDGGALWENGEWLELAGLPDDATVLLMPELINNARDGTPKQQYVAFCLLGQLAPRNEMVVEACAEALKQSDDPGVAAAAGWALRRLGLKTPTDTSDVIFDDPVSGLSFVQLPAAKEFRRGSPPDDPHRFTDEDTPAAGGDIKPIYWAQTELTWNAFAPFLDDPAGDVMASGRADALRGHIATVPAEDQGRGVVGHISLPTAHAFCAWLNERGAQVDPPRRYRLPTEAEWEYACRAGHDARFGFGDDARYARYFGQVEGDSADWPVAASLMPNALGIFDMHGGLWEWTDSIYEPGPDLDPRLRDKTLWAYKGGAYYSPSVRCRCAQRNFGTGDLPSDYNGLRLVMELEVP